ncbi:Caspase domain protein [Rosistilla oblonga]|uniref:Caspase domain protein n=1 Tax=Rosistilla oblonga TaxID=2527990 RepID=A0A518IM82_9BACT|nr:Caspase domain protein [Rosistilla oblonga]
MYVGPAISSLVAQDDDGASDRSVQQMLSICSVPTAIDGDWLASALWNRLQFALPLILLLLSPFGSLAIAEPSNRPRFALLIGVGQYEHLRETLDGCENDVRAMQQMLQNRFGFADSDIVTLLDAEASGAAIRKEMARLQERVSKVDSGQTPVVVFHFSGHGSQVLDQPSGDPDCDEEDGLDETLVPYDAIQQGGDQDIRDDEIYRFVDNICRDGRAKMWMVLDCCHSGTGARGVTKVRKLQRDLRPEPTTKKRRVQAKRLPAGAVFLSACRSMEVEPEYHDGDKPYGLLTRFLVEVLNQESAVSNLSYDLLREAIVARYRSSGSVAQAPTPTLEYGDPNSLKETIIDGVGLDRPSIWPVQSIPGDREQVLMTAGMLHGVTAGSLFELYESPDSAQWDATPNASSNGDSIGWIEVETAEGGSATCRAFQWQDQQKTPLRLPTDFRKAFAIERHHEHGDAILKVRVVRSLDASQDSRPLTSDDADLPEVVRTSLLSAVRGQESPWLKWVGDESACDYLLRIDGDYAAIFPATGVSHVPDVVTKDRDDEVPKSLIGGWGPFDLRRGSETVTQLQDALRRITRARNLIALASRQETSTSGLPQGGQSPVDVALELLTVEEADADYNITKSSVWEPETSDIAHSAKLVMHDGDEYGFRIINKEAAGKPIYVTVLHVDSNMGIDQIHPWQPEAGAAAEGEQKLEPGESLVVPGYFVCNGEEDEKPIYGSRWAIVLATRTPNQFHLLAQGGLPVTRNSASPLETLLLEQTEFKTRGGFGRRRRPKNQYDDSWGATAVPWQVVPQPQQFTIGPAE